MCVALLKVSVLLLSVTWCPEETPPTTTPAVERAGVLIRITPEAVEFSIRLPRHDRVPTGQRLPGLAPRPAIQPDNVVSGFSTRGVEHLATVR